MSVKNPLIFYGLGQKNSQWGVNLCDVVFFLIKDMVVECYNKRFGDETINPTRKISSMNLLQKCLA